MNKATERYIEQELSDYHFNLKYLEEMKQDICDASPSFDSGMPRGTDPGNPTENKGIKIVCSRELIGLERRVNAIEKVLNDFKSDALMCKLIEYTYFKREIGKTNNGIARDLNIDRATFYRKRRQLLQALKLYLGC